jgi:hypothetical protein
MTIQKLMEDLQDSLVHPDTAPKYIKMLNVKQRYDLFYLLNNVLGNL